MDQPYKETPIEVIETFSRMGLLSYAAALVCREMQGTWRSWQSSTEASTKTMIYTWLLPKDRAELLDVIRCYPSPYFVEESDLFREAEFAKRGVK